MAGSSLLSLLDDVASFLDDVASMTKVAAVKTAGVLGDDLALNAQQVTGVSPARELPVVWAVAKGSLVNKAVLVPAALAISGLVPWLVTPLLMLGGAYLCYEGAEKCLHRLRHGEDEARRAEVARAAADAGVDLVAFERARIRGAVRTDFVLSAEIIVIALGIVSEEPFHEQVAVLCAIAVAMTVGVYGLVAGIVKLDDLGLHLQQRGGRRAVLGQRLVDWTPVLMRVISVVGTAAMFLVGGGIVLHGFHLDAWIEHQLEVFAHLPPIVSLLTTLATLAIGIALGAVALAVVEPIKALVRRFRAG